MKELRFRATERFGEVSALLLRPPSARALLLIGHGAGAGMGHAFMNAICERLADRQVATFRYQFPYMEQGKRAPNPAPVLMKTVRSAVAAARIEVGDLPHFAGGKSMGGRMASMAAAKDPLDGIRGLVFFGFPLHPAGKPGSDRGTHLDAVAIPMLFLQGTRDKLADLELLRPVCARLQDRATLHVVGGADHSFHMLKRSGRTDEEALDELATTAAHWCLAQADG